MYGGIITGSLVRYHGCRVVCVLGALLATVGFVASWLMDTIWGLVLTFGIIAGEIPHLNVSKKV